MEARAASIAFAEAFCASDLSRLEALLHPDLRLGGPLFSFDSRAEYLRCLRADPPEPGRCAVLSIVAGTDEAAILYEYVRPRVSLVVAQFNRLDRGLIAEVRLVFDTARLRP